MAAAFHHKRASLALASLDFSEHEQSVKSANKIIPIPCLRQHEARVRALDMYKTVHTFEIQHKRVRVTRARPTLRHNQLFYSYIKRTYFVFLIFCWVYCFCLFFAFPSLERGFKRSITSPSPATVKLCACELAQ